MNLEIITPERMLGVEVGGMNHVNDDGSFQLFQIGDAVASRNVHAAVYDALRLMQEL